MARRTHTRDNQLSLFDLYDGDVVAVAETETTTPDPETPASAAAAPVPEPVPATGSPSSGEAAAPEQAAVPAELSGRGDVTAVAAVTALQRGRANVAAIRILNELRAADRGPTLEEAAVLAGYRGWGGCSQVFSSSTPGLAAVREELRGLVDERTFLAMRQSTTTAFYTPDSITGAMWEALGDAGVTSGRFLEPGCGTGRFIDAAPSEVEVYGVEVDPIAAEIAAHLHPADTVVAASFAEVRPTRAGFDGFIGNVPFADVSLYDPEHNPAGHRIHDAFITKALGSVAPGGYCAVVTSTHTMDKAATAAREEMAGLADIISAVRLPSGVFDADAGTAVPADVLVLRRREDGREPSADTTAFIDSAPRQGVDGAYRINDYFAAHPDHVLGEMRVDDSSGRPRLVVDGDPRQAPAALREVIGADIAAAVAAGYGHSPIRDADAGAFAAPAPTLGRITCSQSAGDARPRFAVWSTSEQGVPELRGITPKSKAYDAEWVSLIEVRDAALSLRDAYATGADADTTAAAQARLKEVYDTHVESFGPITRYTDPAPRKPRKAEVNSRFKDLVAQWRADTGADAKEQPPQEIAEALREQAAAPVVPDRVDQPHLAGFIDPDLSLVRALETSYDPVTNTASRSEFFDRDTSRRSVAESAGSLQEAVAVCRARTGGVDSATVAGLVGRGVEETTAELLAEGLAFRDPAEPDHLIDAREYLSGWVRDKLELARAAAVDDDRFTANVESLETVMPEPLSAADITFRPGMPGLDTDLHRQFAADMLGVPPGKLTVIHAGGHWSVDYRGIWMPGGAADRRWGLIAANSTAGRGYNFKADGEEAEFRNCAVATTRNDGVAVTALETVEKVFNGAAPTVNYSKQWRETTGSGGVHPQATAAIQARAREMGEEFDTWVRADPERFARAKAGYEQALNGFVAPSFDGSARQLIGLSESITPYAYQRNAVERIVSQHSTLLNHVVGAGKTGTMVMAAMELRRSGQARQPWLVVPNHLADQIADEAQQWYPTSRILNGAGVDNPGKRRDFIAATATGDFDLVVVPQSVFERIPVSAARRAEHLESIIDELNTELEKAMAAGGRDGTSLTVKRISAELAGNRERLAGLHDGATTAGALNFESTQCDYLFVDEAHAYKNLFRQSSVADLSHPGSQRASDMLLKLDVLREKNAAVGLNPMTTPTVTFATGTPVANNIAELWVMMKYLRPDVAKRGGIASINDFAAAFTETSPAVEVRPSGSGLRTVMRTNTVINAPDLARLTSAYLDTVIREDVPVALPQLRGGANTVVEFAPEAQLRDYISDLGYRSVYDWVADPDHRRRESTIAAVAIDNSLKIADDGRTATLAPEMAGLHVEGENRRVANVADSIADVWRRTRERTYTDAAGSQHPKAGGFQIVFCDRGTPREGFNVYDAIKTGLVARGMDPARIRFVHDWDHDRPQLFADCRGGEVDVLIGSTEKLGTGANIQTRAVALHHVDVPWRPADLEQREGRIIRQGNQNDEIEVYNYIATGTYDAVQWQTLEAKTQFINQILRADRAERRVAPLDETAERAAAHNKAVATGDPRHVELVELDGTISDLMAKKANAEGESSGIRERIRVLDRDAEEAAGKIAALDAVLPQVEQWKAIPAAERPVGLGGGRMSTDTGEIARVLTNRIVQASNRRFSFGESMPIATIAGITIRARHAERGPGAAVTIFGEGMDFHTKTIDAESIREARAGRGMETTADSAEPAPGAMLDKKVLDYVMYLGSKRTSLVHDVEDLEAAAAEMADASARAFTQQAELDEAIATRAALQAAIAATDQSEQARQVRQERADRNAVHGRQPGWSLRLRPTEGFALTTEGTDPATVAARAQLDEATNLLANGVIDVDGFASRLGFDDAGRTVSADELEQLNAVIGRHAGFYEVVAEDLLTRFTGTETFDDATSVDSARAVLAGFRDAERAYTRLLTARHLLTGGDMETVREEVDFVLDANATEIASAIEEHLGGVSGHRQEPIPQPGGRAHPDPEQIRARMTEATRLLDKGEIDVDEFISRIGVDPAAGRLTAEELQPLNEKIDWYGRIYPQSAGAVHEYASTDPESLRETRTRDDTRHWVMLFRDSEASYTRLLTARHLLTGADETTAGDELSAALDAGAADIAQRAQAILDDLYDDAEALRLLIRGDKDIDEFAAERGGPAVTAGEMQQINEAIDAEASSRQAFSRAIRDLRRGIDTGYGDDPELLDSLAESSRDRYMRLLTIRESLTIVGETAVGDGLSDAVDAQTCELSDRISVAHVGIGGVSRESEGATLQGIIDRMLDPASIREAARRAGVAEDTPADRPPAGAGGWSGEHVSADVDEHTL